MDPADWVALALVAGSLVGVAVGRYPWLRMNRATIALVGAVALIAVGAITLDQAYAALDLHTLTLLFAMMVINANLRIAGFFNLVTARIAAWAHSPRLLLLLMIIFSGLLSAIFLNDTIVLMFTPLVLEITTALKRDPIPYLIGLVSAANIGSTATITGNPQNMLIGLSSGISYLDFTAQLFPVALVGLAIAWLVLVLVYRKEFERGVRLEQPLVKVHTYPPVLQKGLLGVVGMLVAFLLGVSIPLAALGTAALLLITRRLKPQRVFREIDWSLLIFFSGLFIITGAIESSGLSTRLFTLAEPLARQGISALAGVAVVLSNLVSNVPAVMLFRPVIPNFPDPQLSWLTLAMATTLAGNLTLLGSVANLIVAESASDRGVKLTFTEYLKAGVPITLLTLLAGVGWLMLQAR